MSAQRPKLDRLTNVMTSGTVTSLIARCTLLTLAIAFITMNSHAEPEADISSLVQRHKQTELDTMGDIRSGVTSNLRALKPRIIKRKCKLGTKLKRKLHKQANGEKQVDLIGSSVTPTVSNVLVSTETGSEYYMTKVGTQATPGNTVPTPENVGWFTKFFGFKAKMHSLDRVPDVDLRRTNCFNPPQDQGNCDSCALFVAIAQMEYLYCREYGKRIKFSEQFPLDCGEPFGMMGCSGSNVASLNQFISQVGLKEAVDYGYKGSKRRCPYYKQRDRKYDFLGASKFKLRNGGKVEVELRKWSSYLEMMIPLHVGVWINKSFDDYKGGIITSCSNAKVSHAALLVGEGRENGEDFWLMRNSYGVDWGEQGYFKLSKRASMCLTEEGMGFFQKSFLDEQGHKFITLDRKNAGLNATKTEH